MWEGLVWLNEQKRKSIHYGIKTELKVDKSENLGKLIETDFPKQLGDTIDEEDDRR